ncbi:MAG: dihydrodipicolinate synthase family protein [Planctomycetota bacterium]|nr:dihydrodipicolinate synthase family protein [Planctomycetota bacterium]MDA1137744.1 dihydrodipicolinate synthase family protein [Planctomycetota bacterium]
MSTRFPRANLAACVIPWSVDYELDVPVFERHIDGTIENGFQYIYIMGTAGEGYALADAQFRQVVDCFAANTRRKGLHPQVGVISLSMSQIIERISYCHKAGIRLFQISLPAWGALTDDELMSFFHGVCDKFPDCQFLHYNLPRAQRILTGSDYRRVADEVPNLVATKNSSSDYARTRDLMRHAADLQHFFLECNYAFGAMMGECSLLCSEAGLFPKTAWEYFQAGIDRDEATLCRIQKLLMDVVHDLFAHCGGHIDGAYDKTFVNLRDPEFPTRLLPPYNGMSEDELVECRRVFQAKYQDIE